MTTQQRLFWGGLATLGVLIVLGYWWRPILGPFVFAGLLAYLFNPWVTVLTRWHLPRTLAVVTVFFLVFLLFTLMLLGVVPSLQKQLALGVAQLPQWIAWFKTKVWPWVQQHAGVSWQLDLKALDTGLPTDWQGTGSVLNAVLKTFAQSGWAVVNAIANLLLVPVVTFYLLRDWPDVLGSARRLLPRAWEPTVVSLAEDCHRVLRAFLRGQLTVMFFLGLIYTLGLQWVGLELAGLVGLTAGVLSLVPYLGFIVGLGLALSLVALQFSGIEPLLGVLLVFMVGQFLESVVLVPWLISDCIGLHPVMVIFAILAGGQTGGFVGVLLALPIAAVLTVVLRRVHAHYVQSDAYQQGSAW